MYFVDSIGVLGFLRLVVRDQAAFVRHFSLPARLMRALLSKFGCSIPEIRRPEIGDVVSATGIRQTAYALAEAGVKAQPWRPWAETIGRRMEADLCLLVEKYLFEELYDKYLFAGLAVEYAREHEEVDHECLIDSGAFQVYASELASLNGCAVLPMGNRKILSLIGALSTLPILLIYFGIRLIRHKSPDASGSIVCLVDAPSTFHMMAHLFGGEPNIRYFAERTYATQFPGSFLKDHKIGVLGVDSRTFLSCIAYTPTFIACTARAWRQLLPYGALPSAIMHLLLKASLLIPSGRSICVVTAEHLTLPRSARNELLRRQGSSSISISRNSYVTYQQYPAERQLNYDVFCAAGQHAVDLYKKKKVKTPSLLITGSYDTYRELDELSRGARFALLDSFRRNNSLVVFLSPGVCDETCSNERRLIQLAKHVGTLPGVKILIRRKPGELPARYERFYEDILGNDTSVWVTSGEFDLFDFVERADLFVTSISTSACDIVLRGGRVMFVDFMGTPDLYLPWMRVPEIVLSTNEAYEKIADWLVDSSDGSVRLNHAKVCLEFAQYVGCRSGSFGDYKANLINQIRPWLERASTDRASRNIE